jgi:hypothetical protein
MCQEVLPHLYLLFTYLEWTGTVHQYMHATMIYSASAIQVYIVDLHYHYFTPFSVIRVLPYSELLTLRMNSDPSPDTAQAGAMCTGLPFTIVALILSL